MSYEQRWHLGLCRFAGFIVYLNNKYPNGAVRHILLSIFWNTHCCHTRLPGPSHFSLMCWRFHSHAAKPHCYFSLFLVRADWLGKDWGLSFWYSPSFPRRKEKKNPISVCVFSLCVQLGPRAGLHCADLSDLHASVESLWLIKFKQNFKGYKPL